MKFCHLIILENCDNIHLVYSNELEVKDTTDTQMSASYLDRHLEIDNWGRLKTKVYDKRDDFIFISQLPFHQKQHSSITCV